MAFDNFSFALNHMCTPRLSVAEFFAVAADLGIPAVEIRNDLPDNAILDGTPARTVRQAAEVRGLRILSINALQRFNDWDDRRAVEARELIAYAAACGAEALVLVPVNDGSRLAKGEREAKLRTALTELAPLLAGAGIKGLIEPLGFATSSLRLKSEAVEAVRAVGVGDVFGLVHDTFHHYLVHHHLAPHNLSEEAEMFPKETGLVHISGVVDKDLSPSELRDEHRGLVDTQDRLGSVAQIAALRRGGLRAPLSFEAFSAELHALKDPRPAIAGSMEFIESGLRAAAA